MARFKIYEVEEKVTQTGKKLKKLVVQGEGKQYPDKFVTMWENDPLYTKVVPGAEVEAELEIKDSTTPNPHGGFYKNKTLKSVQANGGGALAEQVEDLRKRVYALELKLQDPIEKAMDSDEEEIKPSDIPFS